MRWGKKTRGGVKKLLIIYAYVASFYTTEPVLFTMKNIYDYIIYNNFSYSSVQEENKVNAGSVEAIDEHPHNSDQVC